MEKITNLFNTYISGNEFLNKHYPQVMHDQIDYLFGTGKRVRAVLYLAFINYSIESEPHHLEIAVLIETIHCLSLVIDDLPEMDNDQVRRGILSFHTKWGRYQTEMFIFYILNKVVSTVSSLSNLAEDTATLINKSSDTHDTRDTSLTRDTCKQIKTLIARCLDMLVDGQYIDLLISTQSNNSITVDVTVDVTTDATASTNVDNTIYIAPFTSVINTIFFNLENINMDKKTINQIELNIELNCKKTGSLFNLAISSGIYWQINNVKQRYYKLPNKSNVNDDTDNPDLSYDYDDHDALDAHDAHDAYKVANSTLDLHIVEFTDIIANWSYILGYSFQICDDVLDVDSDSESGKPNLCLIIGIENCKMLIDKLVHYLIYRLDYIEQYIYLYLHNSIYIHRPLIIEIIEKIVKRIK